MATATFKTAKPKPIRTSERVERRFHPASDSRMPALHADPYAALVEFVDDAFMRLYAHGRRNARRITRLVLALIPLAVLLVSSCKTADTSAAASSAAEQFRAALFPGMAQAAPSARPARGYLERARTYIASAPDSLQLLTAREIGYLFGKPAFVRNDAQARVWQYRSDACIVDFYLYGKSVEDSAVAYVDARPEGTIPAGAAARPGGVLKGCIGGLAGDAPAA